MGKYRPPGEPGALCGAARGRFPSRA